MSAKIIGVYVPDGFDTVEEQTLLAMLQLYQSDRRGYGIWEITAAVNDIRAGRLDALKVTELAVRHALDNLIYHEYVDSCAWGFQVTASGLEQGLFSECENCTE